MMAHAYNPILKKLRQKDAWNTQGVPGKPGLHSEAISTNKQKRSQVNLVSAGQPTGRESN